MAPVQTNATLTSVTAGGFTEEPGSSRGAGAGTPKFAGLARVYYRESQERRRGLEGRDVVVRRMLIVDRREPAIEWEPEDVVGFTVDGEADPRTGKIQHAPDAALARLAGSGVETRRLELEPA